MEEFPRLFGEDTKGNTKVWSIKVVENTDSTAEIITEYGRLGGKQTKSVRQVKLGKNIGKKNETTPFQQAVSEAKSKHTKKQETGYCENFVETETGAIITEKPKTSTKTPKLLPMLAHDYNKRGKDIKFPCLVQPKLDGVRALVFMEGSEIQVVSRTGKEYGNAGHIIQELKESDVFKVQPGLVLDGELYTTTLPFEELTGLCRRKTLKKGDAEKLKEIHFWVFDQFDRNFLDAPFDTRLYKMEQLFENNEFNYIRLVETKDLNSKKGLKEVHGNYITAGFEGAILRNLTGPYKLKDRSKDLQKYKVFEDSEYPIVGYTEAAGNDAGTVIWECEYQNNSGDAKTFSVRPRGTREQRQEWFENGEDFIGQLLTVRYQELTAEGCPRFPVGIAIRNYE